MKIKIEMGSKESRFFMVGMFGLILVIAFSLIPSEKTVVILDLLLKTFLG